MLIKSGLYIQYGDNQIHMLVDSEGFTSCDFAEFIDCGLGNPSAQYIDFGIDKLAIYNLIDSYMNRNYTYV